MLTRRQILDTVDFKVRSVDVPEWGGQVFVRTMSAQEREEWEAVSEENGRKRILRATIAALTVCDEKGQLLFSSDDIPALAQKSTPALCRIVDAAYELNRITQKDVRELEGNSDAGRSDDSSSDSPDI